MFLAYFMLNILVLESTAGFNLDDALKERDMPTFTGWIFIAHERGWAFSALEGY